MKKIEAVIFDMDGLMIDTESLFLNSCLKTNEVYGFNVPKTLIVECIGKRKDKTIELFEQVMGPDFDVNNYFDLGRKFKNKEIEDNGIKVKKGLFELLNYLKEHNIKMAVASSTAMDGIKSRLAQAGIDVSQFTSIISGDMVDKPKPDPEVYLKSCEVLGVKPENTIALEDSDYGIKAAHLARTCAVLIPDLKDVTDEMRNDAYVVLKDLTEVIELIENM